MADFNIRTDAVDVEQIMRQIRGRIREKRGVDYTEEQIQEMATVKLEKFLDAKAVRSDLVDQFRHGHDTGPPPPNFSFEDSTLFDSSRAIVRLVRRMLTPLLKLFFNPNPLSQAMHIQSQLNERNAKLFHTREQLDALYYEVIHNLVIETTRLGIEVKNLKMRVESLSSRLDFDERRARALEGIVQARPTRARSQVTSRAAAPAPRAPRAPQAPQAPPVAPAAPAGGTEPAPAVASTPEATGGEQDESTVRRRRRRRRGRRGRSTTPTADATSVASTAPGEGAQATGETAAEPADIPPAPVSLVDEPQTAGGTPASPVARDAEPDAPDERAREAGADSGPGDDPVPSDQ